MIKMNNDSNKGPIHHTQCIRGKKPGNEEESTVQIPDAYLDHFSHSSISLWVSRALKRTLNYKYTLWLVRWTSADFQC